MITPVHVTANAQIDLGQRAHIEAAGTNSRDHGFHDDWPLAPEGLEEGPLTPVILERHKTQLRRAITEKLALIHEEISEALGEIRSGKDPLEIYFSETIKYKDGFETKFHKEQVHDITEDGERKPRYKPEGFLVELADANIRISDLVFLVEGADEYVEADRVKREYNQSRPYKHGRKF
jgi:hypothetical protein